MAEKYQYLFEAGRTGLEYNDLSEAARYDNARAVESGLVS